MTLELHGYQRQAVSFLQNRKRAGLWLSMGLGKSAISLRAIAALPVLIVGPKRVVENVWEKEAALWRPDLTIKVAKGTPAQRKRALESGADIIVIGRDNAGDVIPHARDYKTLILDEASGYKSRSSNRWKQMRVIADRMEYVWTLTGTPSPNGLLDLWAQIYLLDKGERLGTTISGYRSRYFYPTGQLRNGTPIGWTPYPGAPEKIHELLEDLCISMGVEGRIDLPPVTHNMVEVPLSPQTRNLYRQMKSTLVANMEVLGGEIHTASNAAVLSSKLSQISAGFMYVDDADLRGYQYQVLHTEKVGALQEIIDGTGGTGGVLVAYRYKAELEMLKAKLGNLAHTIDEPGIVDRWNLREIPVLLVHPASASMGLNLQKGGSVLVWTTPTWNLEEYLQMNARLARQGQEDPVIIHHLVSPHTVDMAIHQRLTEKKSIQQSLLDHLDSPL